MSPDSTPPPTGPGPVPVPEAATIPRIDSRPAWQAAVRWGLETATARRARHITLVDTDLSDWPLDDPSLLPLLTAWLRLPQRRLVLLAAAYDKLPRVRPRFCGWRRDWAHAIQAWQAPADLAADLPCLLLDDANLSVQLIDRQHGRGRADLHARTAHLWREKVDALLQRAEPGFAVHTLGL